MAPTTATNSPFTPPTPDSNRNPMSDLFPPTDDNGRDVGHVARLLARDIGVFSLHPDDPAACSEAVTMRRVVHELDERHDILFNGMINRLDANPENCQEIVEQVADEIFPDGQFNWGRLVALYAFTGRLAKYLCNQGYQDGVSIMERVCGDYVTHRLSQRITKLGGWRAFEEYFPEPDRRERNIWRNLLAMGLGLGALATMVVVR